MKSVVVITTGGTIAMKADDNLGGAIPTLGAADFSRALVNDTANVRFEEFSNLPSAHLTTEHIWNLSRRVAAVLATDDVDGVVVTHGTDTLEETAFLCDLTVRSDKTVVFTGAMRAASEVGYDGVANLASALQVAASEQARGLGALVVFNDKIHAARSVTKTNTTNLETFQSPSVGPIGFVDYGGVVIERVPGVREFIAATRLEPSVYLLKLGVGMDPLLLDYLVNTHVRGIVIEGLGGGRVPPNWLPVIGRAILGGSAVVVTSRVGSGRTVDKYGYQAAHRDLVQLGCWFTDGLNGQKTRIKLMAALGTSNPAAYFEH